jgi:polyhydroxybutyrate depolymerase
MWTPLVVAVMLGAAGSLAVAGAGSEPEPATAQAQARPYDLQVPSGYDAGTPTPLVVLLHGYTSNGVNQKAYFHIGPVAERRGFLLAAPDGTVNPLGARFWNATDACCNFFGSDVDDVAYLESVIDEISQQYNVDGDRVYLIGHSNGGFMAHRFACDRPGKVAAIVSLAGAQWKDPSRCAPDGPVHVLQVHGDEDGTIEYGGGSTPGGPYPGAVETVTTWAGKNGCTGALDETGEALDIEAELEGAETTVSRYSGCGAGAVELWTILGGSHVPAFDETWPEAAWSFMDAHPKHED